MADADLVPRYEGVPDEAFDPYENDPFLGSFVRKIRMQRGVAAASAPLSGYARALRAPISTGLSSLSLTPGLNAEAARLGTMGGLSEGLMDALASVEPNQVIREAFALADALQQTRTDIHVGSAVALGNVPEGPGAFESIAGGAAAGAAVGGPWGAAVGGLGGLVSSMGSDKKKKKTERNIRYQRDQALAELSPDAVGKTLADLAPTIREQVLAGGYGGDASQDLQAAISRSGLRDSAIGELGSLSAAVAPEQLARASTLQSGLAQTRRNVESILRFPVRQPGRDRLTEALGAVASGYLTYKTLFPTKKGSPGGLLPGPDDFSFSDPPRTGISGLSGDEFLPSSTHF